MKKLALLWLTAIALMFGAGGSVWATPAMGGFHGHGGFHKGHGVVDHSRVDRRGFGHHDFDGRHHFHGHVGVIIGVPVWGPPIYYPPPVYIEQGPSVYIEQGSYYWYYCPDPSGYYPYIQSCSKGWLRVVPDSPSQ